MPDAPPLPPDAAYYLDAYTKLRTERKYENGPIPFSAFVAMFGENFGDAWQIIRNVDEEFTSFVRQEEEKKNKKTFSRATRKGRRHGKT